MESGAKGCEVVVSGKLRAARAKSMKFTVCIVFYDRKSETDVGLGWLHDPLRSTR